MSNDISYQNKDIEFKLLSETYKEKSFEAYGLHLPRIKEVLPTNLPAVMANELRMDNLFLLEDGTLALVDYEAKNKISNRIKYINYIGRLLERYFKENKKVPTIRMIVIYTGNVKTAKSIFQIGCMTLKLEQVFIRKLPKEKIYQTIKRKLKQKEPLTEQELMQLSILPLAESKKEEKQKRIREIIELANQIPTEEDQTFVLTNLWVSTDKFIDKQCAEMIRRCIQMTKVGRLLQEEYEQKTKEAFEKGERQGIEHGIQKGIQKGIQEGKQEEKINIVTMMLNDKMDIEKIIKFSGLSKEEIEKIQTNLLDTK